jgi:predicted nucleotidyltransferase
MKINSQRQTEKLIGQIVERIVSQFRPEKIILFGSYALGTAGPSSDIDLLVVMPILGSRLKMELQIQTVLHDIGLTKDVVVSDPADFEWRKDIVGTIEWPASHEGKVLYARN